jgi:hypothetical protein
VRKHWPPTTIEAEQMSDHTNLSRRGMLLWGGVAAAGAMASALPLPAGAAGAGAQVPTGVPVAVDARSLELYMKLHAATSDGQVPWYYTGRIYAVREGQAPLHLFNLEGTEIYWVRRAGPSAWTSLGSTLTFYRDARTGEYFDSFRNPLNGRTLSVRPNVLRSGKPTTFALQGQGLGGGDPEPWVMESHQSGDDVWLITSRALQNAPQPWIEAQTMTGKASQILDPANTRPPAMFSSSYLAPWLAWLEMGDTRGHLLWHSSGRKLAGISEIPAAYMERARRLQPGHFEPPAGA